MFNRHPGEGGDLARASWPEVETSAFAGVTMQENGDGGQRL